jgi:hypothetical protein
MEPDGRRGLGALPLIPIAALGVLILVVVLIVVMCSGGDSDDTPAATPTPEVTPTPDLGTGQAAAIAAYVQSNGSTYAGDCAETTVEEDAGSVCSISRGEREGIHAYVLGLSFSEGSDWLFLEEAGGAWRVVDVTPITPESASVPGIPWPLAVGAEVVIIGTGSCLNVRTEPGGDAVDCVAEGTVIVLAAGPQEANDRDWWRVEGRDGWVAADYLRYSDATTDPVPTPGAPSSTEETPEAGDGTPEVEATP